MLDFYNSALKFHNNIISMICQITVIPLAGFPSLISNIPNNSCWKTVHVYYVAPLSRIEGRYANSFEEFVHKKLRLPNFHVIAIGRTLLHL